MKRLLEIRLLQIKRELLKAGWWAILVSLIFYVFVVIKILNQSVLHPFPKEILIILLWIVSSTHFARKDKRLLKQIFPSNYKIYMGIEYNLFSLPILIPYFFTDFVLGIILFWVLCFLIAHFEFTIDFRLKNQQVLLKRFILPSNFEWIAGMRKMQYLIIILYLFGIFISFYHFAGFIAIGVITFLFSKFYDDCESQFVLLFECSFNVIFLQNKLKSHIWQYSKFIMPLVLCYFIQYPEKYIFYIPLLVVYYTNFLVFILNKYKSYIPNQKLSSNAVIAGLAFLGMFLPYFFPISFLLVFVFYFKSIRNLKNYFHA